MRQRLVHIADLAPAATDGGSDAGAGEVARPERDAASLAYRDAVVADAPIAYWRFGETSGAVALDESGHGNHAERSRTSFLDEVAVYDKALSADRVKAHHDLGVGR